MLAGREHGVGDPAVGRRRRGRGAGDVVLRRQAATCRARVNRRRRWCPRRAVYGDAVIRGMPMHEAITLGLLGAGLAGCVLGFVPTAWPAAEIDAFDYPKELIFHLSVLSAAAIAWLASGSRPAWSAI